MTPVEVVARYRSQDIELAVIRLQDTPPAVWRSPYSPLSVAHTRTPEECRYARGPLSGGHRITLTYYVAVRASDIDAEPTNPAWGEEAP